MILGRLLRGIDPERYTLVRTMNLPIEQDDYAEQLPARTMHLPDAYFPLPWTTWRLRAANVRSGLRVVYRRFRGIVEVIRNERCDAVVACTGGDMFDLPAAYLAAQRTGARFYPYFFDRWSQQSQGGPRRRRLAERVERMMLRRADTVIVPNPFLARELETVYGARTAIVPNGATLPATPPPEPGPISGPATIVYTGAVYAANHDTFRNLVAALDLLEDRARVHVYTAQTPEELEAAGITGSVDVEQHRPNAEIAHVHATADVLFLPLAFESPYPSLIRTSNPGKMGEYLASGTPILVNAPPDTFVASYFRDHRCGIVVDRLDPAELASAIARLLDDDELRRDVAARAWERAVADYDIDRARTAFAEATGLQEPSVPVLRDPARAVAS